MRRYISLLFLFFYIVIDPSIGPYVVLNPPYIEEEVVYYDRPIVYNNYYSHRHHKHYRDHRYNYDRRDRYGDHRRDHRRNYR